jgi:hypothetical protein
LREKQKNLWDKRNKKGRENWLLETKAVFFSFNLINYYINGQRLFALLFFFLKNNCFSIFISFFFLAFFIFNFIYYFFLCLSAGLKIGKAMQTTTKRD